MRRTRLLPFLTAALLAPLSACEADQEAAEPMDMEEPGMMEDMPEGAPAEELGPPEVVPVDTMQELEIDTTAA